MVTFRLFKDNDIERISKFFGFLEERNIELYGGRKVEWDCFSKHPCFQMFHPEKIGIWENKDEIIGIVRLESPWDGGVMIDINPEYLEIYRDMICYAEETFAGIDEDGNKFLNIYRVSDKPQENLEKKGYNKEEGGRMLSFSLIEPIPIAETPEGFRLEPLKNAYSFEKLNNLLWKALDYEGEPPSYEDDVYLPIKHAWLDYRQDICVVAEAPNYSYGSFCGMWYDIDTKAAFIEPLATAQKYRNMGLAKACIYESMKKCKEFGAKVVYVEPDEEALEWYKKIGFKEAYKSYCWSKHNL